ncbi:MAG: hypothetical protein ACI9PN_002008, partial [Candidatus Azotimanducaceae bacterium]
GIFFTKGVGDEPSTVTEVVQLANNVMDVSMTPSRISVNHPPRLSPAMYLTFRIPLAWTAYAADIFEY